MLIGTAYIADGSGGLRLINVCKRNAPALQQTVATADGRGVQAAGIHAFVADGSGGLRVVELASIGRSMTQVGQYLADPQWLIENPQQVTVAGNYVFLTEGQLGTRDP